jgi:ATP-binding cassette subfamily B protein
MVTSYKTVVAYGKEEDALESFEKTSDEYRACSISARVWGSIMGPIMNFLGNLQYVLLAIYGGFTMIRHPSRLTIGTIQAMLQYSKKFSRPIDQIANQYATILTALAGAERIFEIMDTPDEIDEGKESVTDMKGNIEFVGVDFSYVKGKSVLKDFNLSVKAGQKIAIVGATG